MSLKPLAGTVLIVSFLFLSSYLLGIKFIVMASLLSCLAISVLLTAQNHTVNNFQDFDTIKHYFQQCCEEWESLPSLHQPVQKKRYNSSVARKRSQNTERDSSSSMTSTLSTSSSTPDMHLLSFKNLW